MARSPQLDAQAAAGGRTGTSNPAGGVVYLDHAATTPMRPEAVEAMLEAVAGCPGNPSGSHGPARAARRALDDARDVVAAECGLEPGGVVFTSGGTEADNLAVTGVLRRRGGVAVCSAVEHHAVLEAVRRHGGRVAPVTRRGVVDVDALAELLGPEVSLVSVMTANNETGVIQPLDEVARLVREHAPAALVHTDAVQAYPWLDVAQATASADLVSISAHKFGGPMGVGALLLRGDAAVAPLLLGGGQERDRRSGTQNVAGVVAMAAAARVTARERTERARTVRALRDRLVDAVSAGVGGIFESGVTPLPDGAGPLPPPCGDPRAHKLPATAHLCIDGVESESLLFLLDHAGIAASAAASCASGAMDPSHVLAAMGVDRTLAGGSLRLSLGWSSTAADVEAAATAVIDSVRRLRSRARLGSAVG